MPGQTIIVPEQDNQHVIAFWRSRPPYGTHGTRYQYDYHVWQWRLGPAGRLNGEELLAAFEAAAEPDRTMFRNKILERMEQS